jgi:adenosylmethionine-8-amino-7-oxononanoate aminotransferase
VGALLGMRLRAALAGHPAVVEVRGRGMFHGVELTVPRDAVVTGCLERGVWVYPAGSGPVADAVIVAPPFVATEDEIDLLVAALRETLDELTAR